MVTDSPLALEALARSNQARIDTMAEIDEFLSDSLYRDSYGVTEVRNVLLDIRRKLDVLPR